MVSLPDVGTYLLVLKRPFFSSCFVCFVFAYSGTRAWQPVISKQKGKRQGKEQILLHTQQLGVILFRIQMFLRTSEATG